MQYKDLKEMTIKEWDGEPFEAYYTNDDADTFDGLKIRIVGYARGMWICEVNAEWKHPYPVEWNKEKVKEALNPKPKRMTKRQLAMWLAKGNGECSSCGLLNAYDNYLYQKGDENKLVGDGYKVRKWDSEEWVEPTVDLLEGV